MKILADAQRCVLIGLLGLCGVAQADIHLNFQRIDATHVRVTGSGAIDASTPLPGVNNAIYVYDAFAINPGHLVNSWLLSQNTFKVGDVQVNFAHDAGTGYLSVQANTIYFGMTLPGLPALPVDASVSGSMLWTLPDGSEFAATGSAGVLRWGFITTAEPYSLGPMIGTWSMVAAAVPEPASVSLTAVGGLFLLGVLKRRRPAATEQG